MEGGLDESSMEGPTITVTSYQAIAQEIVQKLIEEVFVGVTFRRQNDLQVLWFQNCQEGEQ